MTASRGLRIVLSSRLERLLDDLAEQLRAERRDPARDAFTADVCVVPSQGLRRWVTLGLADRCGITAGIDMPFLLPFLDRLQDRALGARVTASAGLADDLDPDVLHWRVFAALRSAAEGTAPASFAPLCDYLRGDAGDQIRRAQLAARIADRFLEYRLYRPAELAAFETDRPLPDPVTRDALGPHEAWQRALWRGLAGRDGPGTRHARLLEALTDPRQDLEVGSPVHVFGFGTLSPPALEALAALAQRTPVTLHVVVPTAHHWDDLRTRDTATDDGESEHGLLASLGGPARDTLTALAELEDRARADFPVTIDTLDDDDLGWEPPAGLERGTLLHALQHDLRRALARRARAADGAPRPDDDRLAAEAFRDDHSVEVHCCHGPLRELEIIRDRLLAAFAADPTLRPDDVVVLVPDVATHAPFAEAAFGALRDAHGEPLLPYRIADRTTVRSDECAAAFARILALVGGRYSAAEVADLLELAPVRDRFGIAAEEVEDVRELIRRGGIAWGIDGADRERRFALPAIAAGTWATGLDRLLLGYAIGARSAADDGDPDDDREELAGPAALGGATPPPAAGPRAALVPLPGDALLPAADVTTARAELLGRLGLFQAELLGALAALDGARPLAEHIAALRAAVDRLLASDGPHRDGVARLRDHLARWGDIAAATGGDERIALPAVRTFVLAELERQGGLTAADFPTGRIAICALRPLRTVPFRIVCIAGLDDGAFPRSDRELPFDLIAARRRRGDRSTRADDRLLFLETLLAARERLIVTYTGRSARDDSELAPSSCLAELLDQIDRTLRCAEPGTAARERVVVRAPLQPFDPRHFDGSEPRLAGFSPSDFDAARELGRDRGVPPVAPPAPRAAPPGAQPREIPLDTLATFWTAPARRFVRDVLQARLATRESAGVLERSEPLTLDGLERFRARAQLLRPGPDPDAEAEVPALVQDGLLPPGALAQPWFTAIDAELRDWRAQLPTGASYRTVPIDLVVDLPDPGGQPVRVTGEVGGVCEHGLVAARPAKLRHDLAIGAFVQHVALTLAELAAGRPARSTWLVGIDLCWELQPLDPDAARRTLVDLVAGYLCGEVGPLPFLPADALEVARSDDLGAALVGLRRHWLRGAYGGPDGYATARATDLRLAFRHAPPFDADPEGFAYWTTSIAAPLVEILDEKATAPWHATDPAT
ncbi:MAG: exodeoxyribonuclease V subunit gamma [Planctomycetes bacterium]|nr:exodeoxyribonuclease V subunit gamma [Planctomycetota bacterium]